MNLKSFPPIRISAGLLLVGAALVLSTPASAQRAGQSMTVQTGVVVGARAVDLQSEAGRGAAVGGVAGLAMTSSNRSSSRRLRNTALGAGTGALIANSAQGSRNGMQYTIQTAPGNRSLCRPESWWVPSRSIWTRTPWVEGHWLAVSPVTR